MSASNIEIKLRVPNWEESLKVAEKLYGPPRTLLQTDTCFNSSSGRLKLRECSDVGAELISYQRTDDPAIRECKYLRMTVQSPLVLKEALCRSHGLQSCVRKTRFLFLVDNTRIHFDRVETLGEFVEFEYVVSDRYMACHGQTAIELLQKKLSMTNFEKCEVSYAEMHNQSG